MNLMEFHSFAAVLGFHCVGRCGAPLDLQPKP